MLNSIEGEEDDEEVEREQVKRVRERRGWWGLRERKEGLQRSEDERETNTDDAIFG